MFKVVVMNKIKFLFFFLCISISSSLCAQLKDSLSTKHRLFASSNTSITTPSFNFNFKNRSPKKEVIFSAFNPGTLVYDHYMHDGNTFIYSNSNLFYQGKTHPIINFMLDNDSFIRQDNYLIQKNNYRYRDSFNPYGASNIHDALLGGFIGLLFNE